MVDNKNTDMVCNDCSVDKRFGFFTNLAEIMA